MTGGARPLPDLSRLLHPRAIAVFGGGTWGANVVRQCRRMGYAGPVWPVHPTRDEIAGEPCFRHVEELPGAPDAAFVAVNRALTVEIVGRLAARGAGGAVCFASGFAEADAGEREGEGAALQARLVEAAGAMPVLGPNCYGLLNYLDGAALWPDEHGGGRVERGVAVVTQSSNMLINVTMARRGLPLAYAVAAGNQAQTGLADLARALLEDERVTALGLHIEGVGDLRGMEALAARARALGKPVVALRVGRSAAARAAAMSHTASVAGSDAAGRAFLARLGFGAVDSLPAFMAALALAHVHGALPGREIASMSCSGGEASLVADMAEDRRVAFRALDAADRARLGAALHPMAAVANPLDYHTFQWGDVAAMTGIYRAMLETAADLAFLVLDFPRADRCDDAAWEPAVAAITAAARETGARAAVVSTLPEGMPEGRARALAEAGVAPVAGLGEALAAAEALADVGAAWARPAPAPVLMPSGGAASPGDGPPSAAQAALLDERMAKHALASHGVPVPAGLVAGSPPEAAEAAEALGFPVALKALGLAHKTEHGAVRLGLHDAAAVAEAARSMPAPDGYLVEAMVTGGVAELLLGVTRDPAHGLALTLGAGGTLTEILRDSRTLLLPVTERDVRTALESLRLWPVLAGHRGRAAADLEGALAAVMAVQAFAAAEADRLEELEINPLILTAQGAFAADALLRLREAAGDAGADAGALPAGHAGGGMQ